MIHAGLRLILRVRSQPHTTARAQRILVIAPHQDDETLGCGGLIARHRAASRDVQLLFVTDGAAAYRDAIESQRAALRSRRQAEALAAAEALSVPADAIHFLDTPDGTLDRLSAVERSALIAKLIPIVRQHQPEEIYVTCRTDGSSEHDALFPIVMSALRASQFRGRLIQYPVWAWWSPRLLLQLAVRPAKILRCDSGPFLAQKRSALAVYESQSLAPIGTSEAPLPRGFMALFLTGAEYFIEEPLTS